MNNELRIKLSSYDQSSLDLSIKKIIEIARNNNCTIKGPVPLPTRRWFTTFQRSPHVNKPAMEQFEVRTHKRLIILSGLTPTTIDNLKRLILPNSVELQMKF